MVSKKLLPSTSTTTLKRTRLLAMSVILLSALAVTEVSYAAGRIFYDGFESGSVSQWPNDKIAPDPPCIVVTTATDGVLGPKAGAHMARCNYDGSGSNRFSTLNVDTSNYTNELFLRMWMRLDNNVDRTTDTNAFKLLRYFQTAGTYHDLFEVAGHPQEAFNNAGNSSNSGTLPTYWGGASGDHTNNPSSWHKIEYYFNQSAGAVKVWHDGILIRNDSGFTFAGVKWTDFYVGSNGDLGSSDTTNHWYLDEFEVYSDDGTGATGTMSNATITQGGSADTTPPAAPVNLRIQ